MPATDRPWGGGGAWSSTASQLKWTRQVEVDHASQRESTPLGRSIFCWLYRDGARRGKRAVLVRKATSIPRRGRRHHQGRRLRSRCPPNGFQSSPLLGAPPALPAAASPVFGFPVQFHTLEDETCVVTARHTRMRRDSRHLPPAGMKDDSLAPSPNYPLIVS